MTQGSPDPADPAGPADVAGADTAGLDGAEQVAGGAAAEESVATEETGAPAADPVDEGSTGVPAADEAREQLRRLAAAPLEQHVEIFEDAQRRLQEGLADLDDPS